MSKLRYIGPAPGGAGALPLPEGWLAADHEEPDEAVAAAKVASGMYEEQGRRGKPAAVEEE